MNESEKILKKELVNIIFEILNERGFSSNSNITKKYISKRLNSKNGRNLIKKILTEYKSSYFKFSKKYNFDDLILFIDLLYEGDK